MKFDLIPFPEKIKTLFVLESPHSDEMSVGYPAAGKTGENMSRVILNDNSVALGKLLYEKDNSVEEYGIFNSCQFPLGLSELLLGQELEFSRIKLVTQGKNRMENYQNLKEFLDGFNELDSLLNYRNRLTKILEKCPTIETIVFCGFIAQAIFLKLYPKTSLPPYNKSIVLLNQKTGVSKKILFVNHPSEIDGNKWAYNLV